MEFTDVVITDQPPKGEAFEVPSSLRTTGQCPEGLEYLTQVNKLIMKQQLEFLEGLSRCESENKFRIYNNTGQQVYLAAEKSNSCMRFFCGKQRGFSISVIDDKEKEVMQVSRDFKCCGCCCWFASADCCAHLVKVEAPVGTTVGYVRQMGSFWKPVLGLFNDSFEQIGFIRGPCCPCNSSCCGNAEFPVTTLPDNEGKESRFGMCAKMWPGNTPEMFADADRFNVRFPADLDVKTKVTMLAALFLIDFMFYERDKKE